ncbi:MAG: TniQ family protein [Erythrobacter sp.]|nr:TniQ family protein [Erythrobacter sp.]
MPKIVVPVADELLSGWLARLATFNHCDLVDLLAHVGIDGRYVDVLDFGLEESAAERIAAVARADFELVQSLTISALTPREAEMTAQFPFQKCPVCSVHGVALKHWRRVWSFDCLICGTQLIPNMPRPDVISPSTKALRRARIGARLLEAAVKDNNVRQIHRAMRGVAFAVAVTRFRGSSIAALQGFNPEVRITCLAAICAVQQKPLLKAARIRVRMDDFAKASLLKAYSKEPHLLAAVGAIADRRSQGVSSADRTRFAGQGAPDSHNSSQRIWQNTGQREDSRN